MDLGEEGTSLSASADRDWLERAEVAIATVTAYEADRPQDVQESRCSANGSAWERPVKIAVLSACVVAEIVWVAGLVYAADRFGVLDRLLSLH